MAYTKQTWDTTSYVNPTRMNHIEDGIYSSFEKPIANKIGAGNFFDIRRATPRTNVSTTSVANEDGTVTINGTADGAGVQLKGFRYIIVPNVVEGDYLVLSYEVVSGGFTRHTGGLDSFIYINDSSNTNIAQISLPSSLSVGAKGKVRFQITSSLIENGDFRSRGILIYLRTGDSFSNLKIKIKLQFDSADDETIYPYAMSNKEIGKILGNPPDNAGTYYLKCVVDSNGEATYSWTT